MRTETRTPPPVRTSTDGARDGRPRALTLLALSACLALSGLAAWLQSVRNATRAAAEFEVLANDTSQRLFERLRLYEYGLRGLRGAVLTASGDGISAEQFRIYHQSRNIDREFPGARGFGYARRLLGAEAVVAGGPPSPPDRERYIVQYIEPVERNRPAIGIDLGAEPNRRATAELALRTGKAAITRPLTLVQAPEEHLRGFLILLPIFRPDQPLETEAERLTAGYGLAYVAIVIAEVLAGFDFHDGAVGRSLSDGDGSDGPPEQFYGPPTGSVDPQLVRRIVQPLFGRTWQVELWPQPAFFEHLDLPRPLTVFVVGGVLSSVIAALLYAYLLGAGRRRQLVADQLRLATLVENSSDAMIAEDLRGTITNWNQAAERIFGYRAAEAIGRPSADILRQLESDRALDSMIRTISRGEALDPFDFVCTRRDGSVVELSMTVSPLTAPDGSVIGVGKLLRDVGPRKEAQRQLQEFNSRLEREVGERTAQLETARRDLQTILDAVPSLIGYWDTGLHCRFANHAYHEWFGVDPQTLPGRHIRDLLGEAVFKANRPHMEGALRGEPQVFEREFPRPDGRDVRHSLTYYIPDVVGRKVRGFYVLVHDVTELTEGRQKLAALIRENEALVRTIKSHLLYSVTDPQGRIVDVNDGFCSASGYERDALIGKTHNVLVSGVHPTKFYADLWSTIESGQVWRGEICNRTRDGALFWSDTVIAPFFNEAGAIEKYVAIRKDITARKQAIRELEIERQRLDNILRGTHAGTWEWNVQTGEARFNERWAELSGYSLAELAPASIATWTERTHPDDLARSNALLARHFAGELDHYECEVRVRHRDGRWVWVLDSGRVTSWRADGRPEWMYGIRQDINRSKEAERRLAASEAFLERAGRLAGVGGWQMDLESGELTWTQQTARLLEVPPGYRPALERSVEFFAPEARPRLVAGIAELRARGGSFDIEQPLRSATGRELWVRMIGEAEYAEGDHGRPVRISGAVQDITARHAAERALREAMRAAEAGSAAKSAFLANMSHEIRTPLNAILGLAHLLDRSNLDEEQQRLARAIEHAGQSLLGIVNDVLDLAKIEAGGVSLDIVQFDLRALLDELVALFEPQARSKRLVLALEAAPELPAVVEGDAGRVRQVLVNLLSNAVKFTEEGSIRLVVAVRERTDRQLRICFVVRDTGVGIPDDVRARLFAPFTQADASTTRRFGGTGLGLSIVRRLVEKMGGEVGFASEVAHGSEFWVVLPLALPAAPVELRREAPATEGPRLAGARILVVDDNDINRTVASRILAGEGAVVTTGTNGVEALEHLRAAPGGFDVVLMDIQMPQMDGVEATRRIRGELGLAALPVIALTAGALVAERRRSLDAGMSAFLTKPLDPDTMIRVIQRHLAEGRAA
jgi:PAS domain S-box-containing protein